MMKLLSSLAILCLTLLASIPLTAQHLPIDYETLWRLARLRPHEPWRYDGGYRLLDHLLDSAKLDASGTKHLLPQILLGANFGLNPKLTLSIDGAINTLAHYNQLDGLWLGYECQLTYQPSTEAKLMIRSSNNYALSSEKFYTENHLLYYLGTGVDAMFLLSGGYTSRETSFLTPTEQMADRYPGLIGANSPLRHYHKPYLSWRAKIQFFSYMRFSIMGVYEQRNPYLYLPDLRKHQALLLETDLTFDLSGANSSHRYFYDHPIIRPSGYEGIEIGLRLRKAYGDRANTTKANPFSRYLMGELNLRSALSLSPTQWLDLSLTWGGFFSSGYMSDADRRYFPIMGFVGRRHFSSTWVTMPETFSSDSFWVTTGLNYSAANLLFGKRQGYTRFVDEALHLRTAHTRRGHYLEAGYSVGLGEFCRFGVFAGTDFVSDIPRLSASVSIPLLFLLSTWSERE